MARILIVDDVNAIRKIVVAVLEDGRHKIVEASSGDEALALVRAEGFHLVMTDVNMPGMSGLDLIAHLRAIPEYERMPIVLLTNSSVDSNIDEATRLGANGWIEKPFKPDALLDMINQFLVDAYVPS